MSRWFRLYDDTLNDPKILKLSDKSYRVWIGILCIASKHEGRLPPFDDMALLLRMKADRLQPELEKLIAAGLIDHDDDGLRPHNWQGRQYKSDVSTERVKRFRNAHRNVSETPPETDTEAETEKDIPAVPSARAAKPSGEFEDFWKAYPKRKGANPKSPAERKFVAAVKSGVDPGEIVASARRYADACRSDGSFGSGYVAQALTWLNQQRWQDYPATNGAAAEEVPRETLERGWRACLQAEREGRGWPSTQIKRTDIPEDFVRQFDLENIQFQPEGMQQ